jgi:hypothetical protein
MDDYGPPRFDFADFIGELEAIQGLAKTEFLDASADWVFGQLLTQLKQLRASRGRSPLRWEVTQNSPLRTVATNQYEPGERRGHCDVVGEISWCWDLQNCFTSKGHVKEFEICGNASVRLRVRGTENNSPEFAMWRIESGAVDSPGCYFHTQVLGDIDEPPFPKSLPVPRLPTLFVTPMSAIEFFLGELFQDSWARRLVGNAHHLTFWNSMQRRHLTRLLDWKKDQIEACDNGSPWLALKRAKPRQKDTLFVEKK